MEAKAKARYVRVTPQKARRVVNEVRGKSFLEAADMLTFAPSGWPVMSTRFFTRQLPM